MKDILFLAHRIPFPPDRGDKIRSFHMLEHVAKRARVHLACFADDEADAANLEPLRRALGDALGETCVEVRRTGKALGAARALAARKPISLTLFDSPRLHAFAKRLLARPEVSAVFVSSAQMAQFVPETVRQPFLMDFIDVDSAKFVAYADTGGPLAPLYRREARTLFDFERSVAKRADLALFVSESEAALFRGKTGLPNVRGLANGVDLDFFDPAAAVPVEAPHPLIVFTGQMDYPPNVDAVRWFAGEVLPKVPEATFAVIGRNPTSEVQRLASDRILVTGGVPDVRPWLASATLVCAPLKIARGIQNKVLEAMAMARPVVASPGAFEGIEAEPGRDLLVAATGEGQADCILELISNPDKAARIGTSARRQMVRRYRWEFRLAALTDILVETEKKAAA